MGQRVLVVDDNFDAAESLSTLIRFLGFEVRTAHDGEEAVQVAGEFVPDIVLLDIGLPKLNGYDTARRLRQEACGACARLIALTGWGKEEDRRRSHEAGFDLHIVKPVTLAVLREILV